MVEPALLTRQGSAAMQIARDLVSRQPGERIPRVQDYARLMGTGHGTVQAALRLLESAGAVTLSSHGHKGTYLVKVDYRRLWEVSGRGRMFGSMPLPYSRRYEGLATGLYAAFHQAGVPFSLSYMRGSRNRVEALQARHNDLVVLSHLSAETAAAEAQLTTVATLGPGSYAEHAVILRDPAADGLRDGMRVGIDPASADQYLLIAAETAGLAVTLVEAGYMHLPDMLRRGEIDATIWNVDELSGRFPDLKLLPLRSAGGREQSLLTGEAVVAVHRDAPEVAQILRTLLNWNMVLQVQEEVLAGRRYPSY